MVGIGGIGINAVQGAAMAGAKRIIAVDPVEFKREKAMEFGATHTFASMEEAIPAVTELTWGQMADKVIMTPGVMYGDLMALGHDARRQGRHVVVTAVAPMAQTQSPSTCSSWRCGTRRSRARSSARSTRATTSRSCSSLYREGQLKLDELITKRYTLDEINEGYQDDARRQEHPWRDHL